MLRIALLVLILSVPPFILISTRASQRPTPLEASTLCVAESLLLTGLVLARRERRRLNPRGGPRLS